MNHISPPPPPPIPANRPAKPRRRLAARRKPAPPRSGVKRVSKRSRLPVRKELSAGGVAAREEQGQWHVALLQTEHKRGLVWVLPKGHVELHAQERISDAARREVMEEAGITDLSVKNQLGITRFRFQVEDAVVAKTVHYFLMTTQQKKLTPQAEEGLLKAEWFPIDQAIQELEYDTDQDIVRRAKEKLTGVREPRAFRPHQHAARKNFKPTRRVGSRIPKIH